MECLDCKNIIEINAIRQILKIKPQLLKVFDDIMSNKSGIPQQVSLKLPNLKKKDSGKSEKKVNPTIQLPKLKKLTGDVV